MYLSIIFFLLITLVIPRTFCAPIDSTKSPIQKRSISGGYYDPNSILSERTVKKDVFISRGWGAGGMPFSVLYMSPHSSKAPMEQNYRPAPAPRPKEHHRPKSLPMVSVRNSMGGLRSGGRKSYSIIPQLFVSYGWGPAGK